MPSRSDALKERLSSHSEIRISVTGRKSRRIVSIPVWFVLDGDNLYLLPVQGSDTQWYKNVLNDPLIRVEVQGAEGAFKAMPITKASEVASVAAKFRTKYGASDVKKYYSKLDVAVLAQSR
jgi:deazaflavin-dependent oxidoreductase (nitroreductase family)